MEIQRLRNLTTGILHTDIGYVYEDLEFRTGSKGLMTHMLPRVLEAVTPWLKEKITDPRFWNGEWDMGHTGEFKLPTPTKEDRKAFWDSFSGKLDPLEGKEVVVVV